MKSVQSPYNCFWFYEHYGTGNLSGFVFKCDVDLLEQFTCSHDGYTILSFCEELYYHIFPDTHDTFCFQYSAYDLSGRVIWSTDHHYFCTMYVTLMDSLCYIRMQKQIENSILPKWLAKKLYYRDTREGIAKKFKFGSIFRLSEVENMPISNEEIKTIVELTVRKLRIRLEMQENAEKLVADNPNVVVLKDIAKLANKDISDTRAAFCVDGSDTAFLTWVDWHIFRHGKDEIVRMTDIIEWEVDRKTYIMNIWRYGKYISGEEYDMYEWDIKTWRETYSVYDFGMFSTPDDISCFTVFGWLFWGMVAMSALKCIFK